MKGKFLNNATKKYNSAYGKMKTGGSSKMNSGGATKMKMGGTSKMKKYQGDLSQVSVAPRMSPNEMMSKAPAGSSTSMGSGFTTSTNDTGKRMKRSEKVMARAKKSYQRAKNIQEDVTGRGPNDYDIANRLYRRASRQEARAKRIQKRGR